ncbi:hypothetical protein C1H46_023660 [Malus baccata]|uniref:Uncharacterized protein n=1 Tax=Malus baccata TaxID=106549 RepID=A0A540LWD4_MALBA|nr:hypothetical protein C1H46_023660 [Malus baccata]
MPSSAATNFFHHPNLRIFPRRSYRLKYLKPISSFPRFRAKKLDFSGGFVPKKAVSGRRSRVMASNSMVELIKMLPSRNADGEDSGGEIQPEDYIDGPSELSPLIVDNGLESKLNRLPKPLLKHAISQMRQFESFHAFDNDGPFNVTLDPDFPVISNPRATAKEAISSGSIWFFTTSRCLEKLSTKYKLDFCKELDVTPSNRRD